MHSSYRPRETVHECCNDSDRLPLQLSTEVNNPVT